MTLRRRRRDIPRAVAGSETAPTRHEREPAPDLVTVWRPHRDAPSLLHDFDDGINLFTASSLTNPFVLQTRHLRKGMPE